MGDIAAAAAAAASSELRTLCLTSTKRTVTSRATDMMRRVVLKSSTNTAGMTARGRYDRAAKQSAARDLRRPSNELSVPRSVSSVLLAVDARACEAAVTPRAIAAPTAAVPPRTSAEDRAAVALALAAATAARAASSNRGSRAEYGADAELGAVVLPHRTASATPQAAPQTTPAAGAK